MALVGALLVVLTTSVLAPVTSHPGVLEAGSQQWWFGYDDDSQPVLGAAELHVSAILQHTVALPCRVSNLKDKTVSWIRSRDLSVLAVDTITVTTDNRIKVVHEDGTDDWVLEIRGVRTQDEGTYECQVNTHPKISTKVHLSLTTDTPGVEGSLLDRPVSDTVPPTPPAPPQSRRVRILGPKLVHVHDGGTLRLVCDVTGPGVITSSRLQPLVTWTVGGFPVTSQWPHDMVLVREVVTGSVVESEVVVWGVEEGEGGVFSCHAPLTAPDSVTVIVHGPPSNTARLADEPIPPSAEQQEDPHKPQSAEAAGSTGSKVAVWSGAIILALLLVQAGLCVFYIKKV